MFELVTTQILPILEHVESLTSLALLPISVFSLWAVSKLRKRNRIREANARTPIRIVLEGTGGSRVELPYRPRRDQLSRAELLGILGMYGGKERFETASIVNKLLNDGQLDQVLDCSIEQCSDQLTIQWPEDPKQSMEVSLESEPGQVNPSPKAKATEQGKVFECQAVEIAEGVTRLAVSLGVAADNGTIVQEVQLAMEEADLPGGELLCIHGGISLPAAYTLSHACAHVYAAIAVWDPKIQRYVVSISHSPHYEVGEYLEASKLGARSGQSDK